MNRAVFLDRDGVINEAVVRDGRPCPPHSLEEWKLLPQVIETLQSLRQANFRIIVVTNQPDVATGAQRREVVEAIHARLRSLFAIDDIKVCYHTDKDGCTCRKPKPGMLLEAAKEWAIDLERSFMIGDRWRDIEAGKAAGCRTILVERGYCEWRAVSPDAVVHSMSEAGTLIRSGWTQS